MSKSLHLVLALQNLVVNTITINLLLFLLIMAYNGLTVETAVHNDGYSSHCIPAYPEYDSSTDFSHKAFYDDRGRQGQCDKMLAGTITLNEPSV